MYKFNHVVIGGTFDQLHLGHKALIDKAFEVSEKVSIALSTKRLYQNKALAQAIEPYVRRKRNLKIYLQEKDLLNRANIFPLYNVYGKTKKDLTLEAILVSEATYPNAVKINEFKKKLGQKTLEIVKIDFVKGEDEKPVSSERIRCGEIDANGHNYAQTFSNVKTLILPESLRETLRKPQGTLIKSVGVDLEEPHLYDRINVVTDRGEKTSPLQQTAGQVKKHIAGAKPTMVVSVGDIVTNSLINAGFIPEIQIIDYKSRRKELNCSIVPLFHCYLQKRNRCHERGDSSRSGFPAIGGESLADLPSVALAKGGEKGSRVTESGTCTASKVSEHAHGDEKQCIENLKNKISNSPGTINCRLFAAFQNTLQNYFTTKKPQRIIIQGEEDLVALVAMLLSPLNALVIYGQYDLGVIMVKITPEKKQAVEKLLFKFEKEV